MSKSGGNQPSGEHQVLCRLLLVTVAVYLVGPRPETPRGNRLILVATDHFSKGQDTIAIADATALDEHIFCYLGLIEQLH